MRAFSILAASCLALFVLCISLLVSNARLRADIDGLKSQKALVEGARGADAEAIQTSNEGRQKAAQTAQEGRDALHQLETESDGLPDADFLCRLRGLCLPDGNNGADAAGKPAGGMPRTRAAQRHEGGE